MKRIAILALLVPLLWGSCAEDNRHRIAVEKVIQEEVGKRDFCIHNTFLGEYT